MAVSEKKIEDLRGKKFNIPSYQRGYRWTEFEVTTLLDDLLNHDEREKYCLQPLIVQEKRDGVYDVVDGQQRLTTIYIFLKYMSEEFPKRKSQYDVFQLEYDTRKNSKVYLSELSSETCNSILNYDIDAYHISNAYKAIDSWLEQDGVDPTDALTDIYKVLTKSVFFIWYEILDDEDPIKIFTKVNLGKIPLTNAELIKALILNKNLYKGSRNSDRYHKSISWNDIEYRLQDDSFWNFITNGESLDTRIDFLFGLLEKEYNGFKNNIEEYHSFYTFYNEYTRTENKEEFVDELWNSVQLLFEELNNWYLDLNRYHLIGYLLRLNSGNIDKIFEITRNKSKSEAFLCLKRMALDTIPDIDDISNLYYGRKDVHDVLLLFNLVTLINKSDKQYRFPFDLYKSQKWNIEHIHATADESAVADDSIGNLTLLDEKTNKGYRDKPFNEKRNILLNVDAEGRFITLCTKNVFLKAYSENINNLEIWDESDKKNYVNAIKAELNKFFDEVVN